MEKESNVKYIVSIVVMIFLGIAVIFSAFVVYTASEKRKNKDTISTGSIVMTYTDETNGLSVNNKLTMTDEVGRKMSNIGEYFDFTVDSTFEKGSKIKAKYEIALIKDSSSTLDDSDVKIYLEKKEQKNYVSIVEPTSFNKLDEKSDVGSPAGSMVIYTKDINRSSKDEYRLRIWISDQAKDFTNKNYILKVNIYGKAV